MIAVPEFVNVMEPLFAQVARCIESPHFQVAERALFLWNNEYIVSLIAQNREQILPIVFGALYTNSRSHWNQTVHGLTCNVVKLFMEMDPRLFDECSAKYEEKQEKAVARLATREAHWKAIEQAAEANPLYPRVKHALKAKASRAPSRHRPPDPCATPPARSAPPHLTPRCALVSGAGEPRLRHARAAGQDGDDHVRRLAPRVRHALWLHAVAAG